MTILSLQHQKINKRSFAYYQQQNTSKASKPAPDRDLPKQTSKSINRAHSRFLLAQSNAVQKNVVDQYQRIESQEQYLDAAFTVRVPFRIEPKTVPVGFNSFKRTLARIAIDDAGRESGAGERPLVIQTKSQSRILETIDHESGEIKGFQKNNASLKYDEVKDPALLRHQRFALQKVSRDILKGETRENERGLKDFVFRVCKCHRNTVSAADGVTVLKGSKGAKYSGLQQCGSVWTCPVCSAKISEFRRGQIREMADVWQKSGKGLIFITNTIRHSRNDDLRILLEALTGDVFNRYINHRAYKTARKELGYIGRVRALEVTHGNDNGWHPHIHEIWFIDKPLNDAELKNLQEKLYKVWNTTLVNAGFPGVTQLRGLTIQNASSAADYLAKFGSQPKWDVGHEMTKSHSKKSNGGKGSTPFDLLRSAQLGDKFASVLFKEYAFAFFGKRQLFYSQGLKDFFQIKYLTDDEIINLRDREEIPIVHISSQDWSLIRAFGNAAMILDLADSNDPVRGIENYICFLRKRTSYSSHSP